jgi:photosystem II stability/assembly factor-like uncharacterized protein
MFCSAYASDPSTGKEYVWVGEDGGRIRRGFRATHLQPLTWSSHTTQSKGSIRGICFLADASYGWAVSTDGTLWQSTNQGIDWSAVYHWTSALNDVYFIDKSFGFVASAKGLWSTTDGGGSWNNELVPGQSDNILTIDAIGQANDYLALVGTDGGPYTSQIFSSTGNLLWDLVESPTLGPECAPVTSTSNTRTTGVAFSPMSTTVRAVAYAVAEDAVEPGGFYCGAVYRGDYDLSSPTPWTWTRELPCAYQHPNSSCDPTGVPSQNQFGCALPLGIGDNKFSPLYGLYVRNDNEVIAVGYATLDARNSSGSWLDITDKQYFSPWPVYTVTGNGDSNRDEAWIFGSFGDVRYVPAVASIASFTADTLALPPATPVPPRPYVAIGPQLNPQQAPFNGRQEVYRLGNLFFLDATTALNPWTGWAVGQYGRIATWNDGQSAWVEAHTRCESLPLSSIAFANPYVGVAVGKRAYAQSAWPQIVASSDGGVTWTELDDSAHMLTSSTHDHLNAVAARPAPPGSGTTEFWAVGDHNSAVVTSWDGAAWRVTDINVASSGDVHLDELCFLDSYTAIAVGAVEESGGDKGAAFMLDLNAAPVPRWERLLFNLGLPSPPPLSGVACAGPDAVWFVGGVDTAGCQPGGLATVLFNKTFQANPLDFSHVCAAEVLAMHPTLQNQAVGLLSIATAPGVPSLELLIGGEEGILMRSTDGGAQWASLETHSIRPIAAVSIPQTGFGWALGVRSQDGIHTDTITLRYP